MATVGKQTWNKHHLSPNQPKLPQVVMTYNDLATLLIVQALPTTTTAAAAVARSNTNINFLYSTLLYYYSTLLYSTRWAFTPIPLQKPRFQLETTSLNLTQSNPTQAIPTQPNKKQLSPTKPIPNQPKQT